MTSFADICAIVADLILGDLPTLFPFQMPQIVDFRLWDRSQNRSHSSDSNLFLKAANRCFSSLPLFAKWSQIVDSNMFSKAANRWISSLRSSAKSFASFWFPSVFKYYKSLFFGSKMIRKIVYIVLHDDMSSLRFRILTFVPQGRKAFAVSNIEIVAAKMKK